MDTMIKTTDTPALWTPPKGITPKKASKAVCSFLDIATTAMGRATHYNTRQEQQVAELAAHDALLTVSRDLYTALLALPGLTDRSMQMGMKKLLSTARNGVPAEFLAPGQERAMLYHLIQALPPHRMLKMIEGLRVGSEELGLKKANNARTRKLILRTLLSSPRLQLWSVKYGTKMRAALTHAWGQRLTSIIGAILRRDGRQWKTKEKAILAKNVQRYSGPDKAFRMACECVRFILGGRDRLTLPLFRAFEAAKVDLSNGAKLPMEVLEGLRSTYHPEADKDEVLKLVAKKGSLTTGQKMAVQKRAKAADVNVQMDPTKYDAVRLYLYAFEMGADEKILVALEQKARKAAAAFPARYGDVGILLDASASMAGDKTQPLRPMAVALAMRDMLRHTASETTICRTIHPEKGMTVIGSQVDDWGPGQLIRPMGDTALADGLIEILSEDPAPEAVFVISDGYENAPAGRFAEVMVQVREIGITTPVYHLNPVSAAEAQGVRELAPNEGVPTMPVQQPASLGPTFIRGLIEAEPVKGINVLVRMALAAGPAETRKVLPCHNDS